MSQKRIFNIRNLGFTWETNDPFLFCVHHNDHYPAGNENMGPDASLAGRNLGQDFAVKDGWRMYHGRKVPGFPEHPHRGFETVTIVLKGFVDHSDSHGAGGRYGNGDVQWMTAGAGLQHSEMFPLLNRDSDNPLELFQIWLNLPKAKKFADPHYKMLWAEDIPVFSHADENNHKTEVTIIAGKIADTKAPAPAPDSWASDPENEVAIWLIKMDAEAEWTIPPAATGINRSVFVYQSSGLNLSGVNLEKDQAADLKSDESIVIKSGPEESLILLLQGKPIAEPVVQHGPFVMNSNQEINQAILEYQRTQFGGWPWPQAEQVFPHDRGRFARYADGKEEIRDR